MIKQIKNEIFLLESLIFEVQSGFNVTEFKSLNTIVDKIKYAKEHLKFLGKGSSRAAFDIPGTGYVLKMAFNNAGYKQNQNEVDVYTDPKVKDLVARIKDFGSDYSWIIAEKVMPFKKIAEFEQASGMPYSDYKQYMIGHGTGNKEKEADADRRLKDNHFFQRVKKLIHDTDLDIGDLVYEHFGKTIFGNIKILDYGYTKKFDKDYNEGDYNNFTSVN